MHESRNDLAMLIGSIFLLIRGGGYGSLDLKLQEKNKASKKIEQQAKQVLQ